jgi:hypothetical protein
MTMVSKAARPRPGPLYYGTCGADPSRATWPGAAGLASRRRGRPPLARHLRRCPLSRASSTRMFSSMLSMRTLRSTPTRALCLNRRGMRLDAVSDLANPPRILLDRDNPSARAQAAQRSRRLDGEFRAAHFPSRAAHPCIYGRSTARPAQPASRHRRRPVRRANRGHHSDEWHGEDL